jgi:hypothetical protein
MGLLDDGTCPMLQGIFYLHWLTYWWYNTQGPAYYETLLQDIFYLLQDLQVLLFMPGGCSTSHNILRALFYLTHFLLENWDAHTCQAVIYRLQMGVPGLCLYFGCFHRSFLTALQSTAAVRSSQCCTWRHSHHGLHFLTDIRLLCHPWLRWLYCWYCSQLLASSISRWIFRACLVCCRVQPGSHAACKLALARLGRC